MGEANSDISIQGNETKSEFLNKSSPVEATVPELQNGLVFNEKGGNEKKKLNDCASTVSKIARPTSLKSHPGDNVTTSKIARLCNNMAKAQTPSSACSSLYAGEADQEKVSALTKEKWTIERNVSSGSILSDSSRKSTPDDLTKMKLSEVQSSPDSLSDYINDEDTTHLRSSDTNMVLTENTDQFIIGDRVWVGGVKPGQIAYIGETQFAPGEWAGVVLDEPIGKNDGTVANIRYFQCEPKKGIFSRLTRLTKYPLGDGGAGEPAATKPAFSEIKRSNGSLAGSLTRKSPLSSTSSFSAKNAASKPLSPDSGIHPTPSLDLGDRVIIKSSQGSKAGILRYIGTTEFAPGEWCGVELDDPLGKNDGSVAGVKYFECEPKFGLFAPLHKVSKSPANKRLFQPCMVHPNRTSLLRRHGSKESLMSMSSAASTTASIRSTNKKIGVKTPTSTTVKTTLQEALKKKELQIEKLLKERDLERTEVTRAANQADEAERQLRCMKNEFENYKKEVELRLGEMDALVCRMKTEKIKLLNQLDDEKKKYEDLQFRFEEETIDKADVKSKLAEYEENINLLQKTLAEERKRVESLEHDSNKLFETEEQMIIIKDERDTMKEELDIHRKVRSTLEQEHISLEAHLTAARAEVESLKIENRSLKEIALKDENSLKENFTAAVQNLEETKRELNIKNEMVEKLSEDNKAKDCRMLDIEKDLKEKLKSTIEELSQKHSCEMSTFQEDLNKQWEVKLKVLENQVEEKVKECKIFETKFNELNISMSKKNAELQAENLKQEKTIAELQNKLLSLTSEIENKDQMLKEKKTESDALVKEMDSIKLELEKAKNSIVLSTQSTDKQTEALKNTIDGLRNELQNIKEEMEAKLKENKILIEMKDAALKDYEEKNAMMRDALQKKEVELLKLKDEFEVKNKEAYELHQSREKDLLSKIESLKETERARMSEFEKLNTDMETLRKSLELEQQELKNEQRNSKNLSEKLLAVEENCTKMSTEKNELELETGEVKRKLLSAEKKINQLIDQKTKLEKDISTFMNSSKDSSLQLTKLNEDLRAKEREADSLREEIIQKTSIFERTEHELNQKFKEQEEILKAFKNEEEKNRINYVEEIKFLNNRIEASTADLIRIESEYQKKMEVLANDAETKINTLEENIKVLEEKNVEGKLEHEKKVKELEEVQKVLEKELNEVAKKAEDAKCTLEKEIQELKLERVNLLESAEKAKADRLMTEKKWEDQAVKNVEMWVNKEENLNIELEKTKESLHQVKVDLQKALEEKGKLNEDKLNLDKILAETVEHLKVSQNECSKLTINVSSMEVENKILKEALDQLREEKCSLDKDMTEKVMLLTDLTMQINSLQNSKKTSDEETGTKIKHLEKEILDLQKSIEKTEAFNFEIISKKDQEIKKLEKEIQNYKEESSQILSRKEKDVESINLVTAQIQEELNRCRGDCDRKSETIESLEKKNHFLAEELQVERNRNENLKKKGLDYEKQIYELSTKFEEQNKLLTDNSNLAVKMTEIGNKLAESERREGEILKNMKSEKKDLTERLESTKILLNQKESEAKELYLELESLKTEKAEWQKKEKLYEESKSDQKHINLQAYNATDEPDFEKGQVDFLNSVIVDMQKKNDALKARIEILEMGYSPEDVEEFNLHNINARSVAPRLFCDICDRFDLHDTDDCPTQAGEEPSPLFKSSKSKVLLPQRPYCDICEIFGHDTADCDAAETF